MPHPLNEQALDQLFREGRTANTYTDDRVAHADMVAIWDLMKFGPTSANQLPARLIWCASADAKARLAPCMSDSNREKVLDAPVAVIIGMDLEFYEKLPELFPHADARTWFVGNQPLIEESAFRNSSLQGAYFIMAARALGLDTGPMSGFDSGAVDAAFFAGTPIRTNFIATLGHGDPATIFPRSPRPPFDRFNTVA